jgi:cobalt-zinc-cadmium efflux system membrane fusion protein
MKGTGDQDTMKHLLIGIALLAVACGSRTPPPPAANDAEPAAAPRGRQVKLSAEQQKKWGIVTGAVSRVTVTSNLTLPGTVGVNQNRTAHVSAVLEGKVVGLHVDLGQEVRTGQVLLVVHAPAFAQAKTALLEASAKLNLARKEVDRARTLLKGQAIQEKEVLRREAEYQAASTEYGVAESGLHSFGLTQGQIGELLKRYASNKDDTRVDDVAEPYLEVTAPVDGRVIFKDVIAGEHVHPDKILLTISDLASVWATLDAREIDLPSLRQGTAVSIRSAVYPDRVFAGRIDHVGDVVDEKLRTIKVRVEVQNAGFILKPNMYIQGGIVHATDRRQVLAVPDEGVQTIDGEPMVFVREAADVFALRPVQIGERVGANRVILKGLDGTEAVVVAGAFTLKAELLKGTFGEGG